jgi:hypothetical protein
MYYDPMDRGDGAGGWVMMLIFVVFLAVLAGLLFL